MATRPMHDGRAHAAERNGRENDRGLSLIATLWIMAVLSILATEYLYTVYLDRRMGQNLVDRTQLEYAARAAIAQFIRLIASDETAYDASDDEWANGIEGEIEDVQTPTRTFAYELSATDENARIDVNQADQSLLQKLLALAGADEQTRASLAAAIVQERENQPFRTPGDLARVEGMTTEILYGAKQAQSSQEEGSQAQPLINLITVYSVDKNVQADGSQRTNITSADADALRQGLTDSNGNELLSQQEAEAIVAYRGENAFKSIGDLFDVPAITEAVLDGARDRLTTEDEDDKVNINQASADELAGVDGFDQGTAEDVVRHRNQNGNYDGVDAIRDAKVLTRDEMKQIADKVTVSDDSILKGLVNVNTASRDILALLPGMDEQKADAIVQRRGDSEGEERASSGSSESQPFQTLGDLLDVQAIDEDTFKQLAGAVTYRTQVFRIEAAGSAPDGAKLARIVAVLDRSGQQVQFRYWRVQ